MKDSTILKYEADLRIKRISSMGISNPKKAISSILKELDEGIAEWVSFTSVTRTNQVLEIGTDKYVYDVIPSTGICDKTGQKCPKFILKEYPTTQMDHTFSMHVTQRMFSRAISLEEILEVIEHGTCHVDHRDPTANVYLYNNIRVVRRNDRNHLVSVIRKDVPVDPVVQIVLA